MLVKHTNILDDQRVELYYGPGPSARYLATRFINNQMKNKWLSFDVTEPLQTWFKGNGNSTSTKNTFFSRKPASLQMCLTL